MNINVTNKGASHKKEYGGANMCKSRNIRLSDYGRRMSDTIQLRLSQLHGQSRRRYEEGSSLVLQYPPCCSSRVPS